MLQPCTMRLHEEKKKQRNARQPRQGEAARCREVKGTQTRPHPKFDPCGPPWSPAGTGPELLCRQSCPLRQGLELGPHDGVMHARRKSPLREAAVSTSNHVLPPDQSGVGRDAPGDQFRVLDEVSRMGAAPGDEDLAVGELNIFPALPLMLMARVGSFHTVGVS